MEDVSTNSNFLFFTNRNEYKGRLKALAIFCILASMLTLIALISYTKQDEANAQISLFDLLGLFTGDEIIKIKALSTHNWLGIFGAFLSDKIYNGTFGYSLILLPVFGMVWFYEIFKNLTLNKKTVKYSIFYLFSIVTIATLSGVLRLTETFATMPKEWSGSVGYFIAELCRNVFGVFGTFSIFSFTMFVAAVYAFSLKPVTAVRNFLIWLKKHGYFISFKVVETRGEREEYAKEENLDSINKELNIEEEIEEAEVVENTYTPNFVINNQAVLNETANVQPLITDKTADNFTEEQIIKNKFSNLNNLKNVSRQDAMEQPARKSLSITIRNNNVATGYERFFGEETLDYNSALVPQHNELAIAGEESNTIENRVGFGGGSNNNSDFGYYNNYNDKEPELPINGVNIYSNSTTELPYNSFEELEDELIEDIFNEEPISPNQNSNNTYNAQNQQINNNINNIENNVIVNLNRVEINNYVNPSQIEYADVEYGEMRDEYVETHIVPKDLPVVDMTNPILGEEIKAQEPEIEDEFLKEFNQIASELAGQSAPKEEPIELDSLLNNIEKTLLTQHSKEIENEVVDLSKVSIPIERPAITIDSNAPITSKAQLEAIENKFIPQATISNYGASRAVAPPAIAPISTALLEEKFPYTMPGMNLLRKQEIKITVDEEELREKATILQNKLLQFKINISDINIIPGPVVTQYEFALADGIKVSRVEALQDDIAMALKARGIRILAPVPGKDRVGVEIPNNKPQMVLFSALVDSIEFRQTNMQLPLALGKMTDGKVFVSDLAKMPHVLVAGATGSGKSVGINTIMASLLYKKRPEELKFVIIDPKKVELAQYRTLDKHYLATSPDVRDLIVTQSHEAVSILKSLVLEMELRYDLLADVFCKNLTEYNEKIDIGRVKDTEKYLHKKMPYLVVIIDEFADLILTAKEVEEPVQMLAQKARAIGIHIVLATQRPSVDVITGIIKANFPTRMAYMVTQKVDSKTILDMNGAEQLLGNGDMLIVPNGSSTPIRLQNAYISSDESEDLASFIGSQPGYSSPYMLPSINKAAEDGLFDIANADPLFMDAVRMVIREQQATVSNFQRKLSLGFSRAGRLMDDLERAGIVSPANGTKPRQCLLDSMEEFERLFM